MASSVPVCRLIVGKQEFQWGLQCFLQRIDSIENNSRELQDFLQKGCSMFHFRALVVKQNRGLPARILFTVEDQDDESIPANSDINNIFGKSSSMS